MVVLIKDRIVLVFEDVGAVSCKEDADEDAKKRALGHVHKIDIWWDAIQNKSQMIVMIGGLASRVPSKG